MSVNSRAYYASLVTLPVVIDAPGPYLMRCGETVVIDEVSGKHDHGCSGTYECGLRDCWHKSGRLYFSTLSQNDIISKKETF